MTAMAAVTAAAKAEAKAMAINDGKKNEEINHYSSEGAAKGSVIIIFLQGTLLAPMAVVISL